MSNASVAVYKGGEVTLRYHFMQQRLGDLRVDRHEARLGFSYTPTTRPQFEGEVPYQIFTQGSASAHDSGNVIGWIKYRFYNSLETGGDRQAAIRVGIELPTASKNAASAPSTNEAEFLRRQLLRIDGGLSAQVDAVYSRAKRRFVYVASVEGVIRREFVGVRMGDGRGSGVRPPAAKLSKTRIAGGRRYIPAGNRTLIRRLAVRFRINYPLLFGTRRIAELYGVTNALPVMVIVGRQGRIEGRIDGVTDLQRIKKILQ